jgi:hypothetical protein
MSALKHVNQQQFSAFKDKPSHAPATGAHSVPDLDAREWGTLMGHMATMAPGEPLDDLGPSKPITGPMPARPSTSTTSQGTWIGSQSVGPDRGSASRGPRSDPKYKP